ncbi:MAG: ADP-ribosylglycohydrolase family protein [Planctomycetota bacterium]
MLIELAIGDAYGAAFEYAPVPFVREHNDLRAYVAHPTHGRPAGTYTDDTQMSIAIAELMVAGEAWTPENLAAKFVEVFKRDPRTGYASSFYGFLCRIRDGSEFVAKIRPTSDKSGGAMRAPAVGLYPDLGQVIERSSLQASLTHDTEDGRNAAVAASLMTHYCCYRLGRRADMGRFIREHVSGRWDNPWHGKVKSKGWMSVRAAITAVSRSSSMSELLRTCVAFTGDVDTVAAVAMAAGSCCSEIEQDLPAQLVEGLENNAYGRDYLIGLDKALFTAVGLPSGPHA